jgi:hypothetical protein
MLTKQIKGLVTNQNRKKIQGREAKVYVAIPPLNKRARLADQVLYVGGFIREISFVATPADGNYVLTYQTVDHTVAAAGLTASQLIDAMIAEVNNGSTAARAILPNYTDRKFLLVSPVAATVTQTSPNSNADMTVGSESGGATAAKGDTSIALAAATIEEMQIGQFLHFSDHQGFEYMAELTAQAPIGSTLLTVRALPEAIPHASTCEFPVYVWNITAADINRTYNLTETQDFNSGQNRDGEITGGSSDINLPGVKTYKNAGAETLRYIAARGSGSDF